MTDLKRTPLFEAHGAAGARMVPFAGFEMPVSYSGIIEEHTAVRERAGIFDVSHMGEFIVRGRDTWAYLDRVITNDCSKLADDGVMYTVMCRDDGTVVDDLLVTRLGDDSAMVVVNAANIDKDAAHMRAQLSGDVDLEDASEKYALLAVQGPRSRDVLLQCPAFDGVRDNLANVGYYRYFRFEYEGETILVSRTGYTGELGFEIFIPTKLAVPLWDEIVSNGEPSGLTPVGLAARDTLRFEASFCLYGHELDDRTTPLEAGLRWVVKLRKGEFTGRDALARELETGSARRLMGFALDGRSIARQGYALMREGKTVGLVTSGTFAPTLQRSLCMAYVDVKHQDATDIVVAVRNKLVPVARVGLPFYPSRARA